MLLLRIFIVLILIQSIQSSNFCQFSGCDCRDRRAYCVNIPKVMDRDLENNRYGYYFNHIWIRHDCTEYEKILRYFKKLNTFECGNMNHVITLINDLKHRIHFLESTKCGLRGSDNGSVHSFKNELRRLKASKSELETELSDKLFTLKCFKYANFTLIGAIIMVFAVFAGWNVVKRFRKKHTNLPPAPAHWFLDPTWKDMG